MVKCQNCQHIYEDIDSPEISNSKICDYCGSNFIISTDDTKEHNTASFRALDYNIDIAEKYYNTQVLHHASNKSMFMILSLITVLFVLASILAFILAQVHKKLVMEESSYSKFIISAAVVAVFLTTAAILICAICSLHKNCRQKIRGLGSRYRNKYH